VIDISKTFRAIIFDFDGTIIDSNDIKREAFAEIFSEQKFSKTDFYGFVKSLGDIDRYSIIKTCAHEFFSEAYSNEDIKNKIEMYSEITQQQILLAKEIPGALDFIKKMYKKNIPLFICSATPEVNLIPIIKSIKLMKYFSRILGGPKTKEENIKFILSDYNFDKKDILYIGDSDIDFKAAKNVGCDFIGIVNKDNRFSVKPRIMYSSYKELINYV